MALIPDKTRTEHGLTIYEKLIPDTARWTDGIKARAAGFQPGAYYKANRKLSNGSGKPKGITIHNTDGSANAETYTRATWPNQNMKSVRVHYYVDDTCAWQNLREDEVGWHATDGFGNGNETTLSLEIIMRGKAIADDAKSEQNGALLCAILLNRHGLTVKDVYPHHHWYAAKQCPTYILPHWNVFLADVQGYLTAIQEAEKPAPVLRVGAKAKLIGTTYVNGKRIPDWVKKQAHVVSQISGNKVLLGANGGINSWVFAKDIMVTE